MMNRRLTILILLALVAMAARAGSWIRINQLGYLPDAIKVAVLMSEDKVDVHDRPDRHPGRALLPSDEARKNIEDRKE